MKKKKLLLVALPAVLCTLATGAMVGCGEEHEHSYTKWGSDETQHWLVCPDDNAKDENSVADHEYGLDGKCECGYEKPHTHAYTKWKTSDTEHWKVCPEDNQEQAGSRAPHSFADGKCECGKKDNFSGEVTVNEKFNGKTVTLKKDGQTDVAFTVANGKATLNNVKLGEWTATCDLLGATVKATVTIDEYMSELDLSGFVTGTAKMDVATGSYTWHRQSHETAKVELAEEASGDQFVALKIATGTDFFTWTTKTDEIRFGVAMTVNGEEHVINLNWRNWERANIGFSSDIKNWQTEGQDKDMGAVNYRGYDKLWLHLFNPNFAGWDDKEKGWSFGTYGGAIIEDGVYFIYQYEASTGNVNVYLSDGETYIPVYTEEAMFAQDGKLTAFGVTAGETDTKWAGGSHNSGIDREFTFTLGYGSDMNTAVGGTVSEWRSTLNITGNGAEADKTAYEYGEEATINITVPANKIAIVTVDGGAPVIVETGTFKFNVSQKQHTVNVEFVNDEFTGEVAVDEAFNGKTITLKKDGQTDVVLTVANGKVNFNAIKLGEWTATCNLFGTTIKGKVTITYGMTELDLSGLVAGTADVNIDTGAFVYQQKKENPDTVGVELAQGVSGDAYVSLKLSTDIAKSAWADDNYEELHVGLWMTVGGAKHWVGLNWRNWEIDSFGVISDTDQNGKGADVLKAHLWSPVDGFTWDNNHRWNMGAYGNAFIADGMYLVMKYDSATGNVDVLLANADGYVKVYTFEGMFKAGQQLTAFGVGSVGNDYGGYHNCPGGFKIDCVLNYGTTLNTAIGGDVSGLYTALNITGNKDSVTGANVVADKTAYEYGETATVTITVPANKVAIVTVDGGASRILEATGTITLTVSKMEYTVNVEFVNDEFTGEVAVDAVYNGKTITLKKDGQTDVEFTVADGKVNFTDIKLGEWTATCSLFGTTLKGKVTITYDMTELDLSGFNAGTADINLTTGEFVYTSVKDNAPTVGIELAEAKTGDTYVGLKISTDNPWNDWTVNNFEELHLGVWMTVGGAKHWVELHWRNWDIAHFAINSDTAHDNENASTGILKDILWKPIDGFSFENHCWDEMPFGEAFMGDGIYLIMKYDSATGNVDVLLAKNDGYVKVCTFEGMFEAGQELTAFGVGSIGEDYGYHNTPGGFKIDCVLSVGSSLQDITGAELNEWTAPATPEE